MNKLPAGWTLVSNAEAYSPVFRHDATGYRVMLYGYGGQRICRSWQLYCPKGWAVADSRLGVESLDPAWAVLRRAESLIASIAAQKL